MLSKNLFKLFRLRHQEEKSHVTQKILTAIFILFLICGIVSFPSKGLALEEAGQAVIPINNNIVNLDQGWTKDTQQRFYFVDQGSQLMPYPWFLALEQDSSQELFRSDKNMSKLRYFGNW
ncbi:MAG: hypothetical protein QNJ18_02520 [Xenococcaceae cyanobacterium MO_167.B52]|nr:hypothetical protein [Xenococcaceae cyanobacterium MO_167.B52]